MSRRKSRAEVEIEAKLESLDPASKRFDVLAAVRDFKASWVQVGEKLTEVREKQLFQDWSYASFEAYCRGELRIKNDTANKLTRSFSFLRDHKPQALHNESVQELPPLDVVDLLSKAKEKTKLSPNDFQDISREVFNNEPAFTKNQLMRRIREKDPEAFKAAPRPDSLSEKTEIRKALLLAERLHSLLESLPTVPARTKKYTTDVVQELRQLFTQND